MACGEVVGVVFAIEDNVRVMAEQSKVTHDLLREYVISRQHPRLAGRDQ